VWVLQPGAAPMNLATAANPPYTSAVAIQDPTGAAQGGTASNTFLVQGFGDVGQGWGVDIALAATGIFTPGRQITNLFIGAIAHGVEVPSPQ
jgi:hypothetical protein